MKQLVLVVSILLSAFSGTELRANDAVVASGTYLYRIVAGSFVASKELVFIK